MFVAAAVDEEGGEICPARALTRLMDHIEMDIKFTVVRSHKGAVRLPPIRRASLATQCATQSDSTTVATRYPCIGM